MLDKLMDRLMESAASSYMPKLEEIAEARKAELADMKSRVRDDPEQVEMWFDREIAKLSNIDVGDMVGKLR